MTNSSDRYEREHVEVAQPDDRLPAQRDRDRVLYTSAFRRLAGVTQVAGPLESYLFHNRLTHSLEVAQISRRIAERLIKKENNPPDGVLDILDPDVVESASLIHDIGHPPFGHVAEKELDTLATKNGCDDGFEGNAQSFRIVTHLASHRVDYYGLNLTRATLNASLKYPWLRDLKNKDSKTHRKFSAYIDQKDSFQFARKDTSDKAKSLEAQIMDFADDVAYSVHDLDDFYRAGLLPLEMLYYEKGEFGAFLSQWKEDTHYSPPDNVELEENHLKGLLFTLLNQGTFTGSFKQRANMRTRSAHLIRQFVLDVRIDRDSDGNLLLKKSPNMEIEIQFLKQIIWYYVICNPRLATQQEGHRKAIQDLFHAYANAVTSRNKNLVPGRFHDDLNNLPRNESKSQTTRIALDIVANLTDSQAHAMYRRINGVEIGALSDIVSW